MKKLKEKRLEFVLSYDDFEEIAAAAASEGLTVSAFVRMAAIRLARAGHV